MSGLASLELTPDEIRKLLREDLDFLAGVLNPEETTSRFPPFYKQVWALIIRSLHELPPGDVFRFALGLPRGHVKTTFIKLLIVYLIIHDYGIDFFLVVCATEPLAENFLADVKDMLASPIIIQLYGDFSSTLDKDTKKLVVNRWYCGRPVILGAIGAQTSVRGMVVKNKRPQLIVCDDVQTREKDDSPTERAALLRWLTGTLFKARTKTGKAGLIYVGNMYSDECILAQLANNPHWISLITGALLADGTALWPEINSVEQLIEEFYHDNALGEGATWFAEVQNDPIGLGSGLLDPGETLPSAATSIDPNLYPTRFICIDPAGAKQTSDDNVIGVHAIMEDDQALTLHKEWGKLDPKTVIERTFNLVLQYQVPIIFVESNGYQGTLAFWINHFKTDLGLHNLQVIPLPSGRQSKFQRLRAYVKSLVSGRWHIHRQEDLNAIAYQIYKYRIEKKDNQDDIIDEEAMALMALNKHYGEILAATPITSEEDSVYSKARVNPYNTILDVRTH